MFLNQCLTGLPLPRLGGPMKDDYNAICDDELANRRGLHLDDDEEDPEGPDDDEDEEPEE